MMVDGAWLGDPESKPCEMGGGALVDYSIASSSGVGGGKTAAQAVKMALRLASGTAVVYVGSEQDYLRIKAYIEQLLRSAQVFPVAKYTRKFKRGTK